MSILDREIRIINIGIKNNSQLEKECNGAITIYKERGFFLDQLALNNGGIILVFVKAPAEETS